MHIEIYSEPIEIIMIADFENKPMSIRKLAGNKLLKLKDMSLNNLKYSDLTRAFEELYFKLPDNMMEITMFVDTQNTIVPCSSGTIVGQFICGQNI